MAGLLAHEWLAVAGGSENVLEELIAQFPDADVEVLWNDAPARFPTARESWIARTPLRRSKVLALPFMLGTWRMLSARRDYDWILVSSHLFAHHIRLRSATDTTKLVYAHTPARYIWTPELDARGDHGIVRAASTLLRPVDRHRAREARAIAANSHFTRERILNTWERDSEVIYPPVDTETIRSIADWSVALEESDSSILNSLPDEFLLGASRLVPYKRLDLVLEAARATEMPVVIAGSGPEDATLRAKASTLGLRAHFVPRPSTELLYALYQRSTAFVFPSVEDFGIMPVEAMACGTPVIVPRVGGAAESVALLEGGAVVAGTGTSDWREALTTVSKIDRQLLGQRAEMLSRARFRSEIANWVARESA